MLRPYQSEVKTEIKNMFIRGEKSVLVTAPTGSGKTVLAADLIKSCSQKGMKSWFIVHRRELITQSSNTFKKFNIEHGIISAGENAEYNKNVQICGIQTLANRINKISAPNLIVFDEAHHCSAGSWNKIFQAFPESYKIGLTATPKRLDGAGLGNHFSCIVKGPSVKWLIENKYLSKYKIYAPSNIDISNVKTLMGDYSLADLAKASDKPSITGCAIEHYKKLCNGMRAVVFCCSIKHSKSVAEQFNNAGIPACHVDGETPREERDRIIKDFSENKFKILCNIELFGEGFDLPAMEAVILLRPTQSLVLYMQQVGRVLRIAEGKQLAIILDHAGNCFRHGMPCEDREWDLSTEKTKKPKNKEDNLSVTVCPSCFAAQESGCKICVYCGYEIPVKPRKVEIVKGSLEEITEIKLKKQSQGMCKTLEDLVAEGKKRGYKNPHGWAHCIIKARNFKKYAQKTSL